MPKNLELIQAAAFAGETSLTKVTFYDSLTDIQMAAFAGTRFERSDHSGKRFHHWILCIRL